MPNWRHPSGPWRLFGGQRRKARLIAQRIGFAQDRAGPLPAVHRIGAFQYQLQRALLPYPAPATRRHPAKISGLSPLSDGVL
jgi:hypothetical protein